MTEISRAIEIPLEQQSPPYWFPAGGQHYLTSSQWLRVIGKHLLLQHCSTSPHCWRWYSNFYEISFVVVCSNITSHVRRGKYWSCNCPEASMLLISYWTRSEILPNRNQDLPIGRQRIWFAYLVPSLGILVTKMQISDLLIPIEVQMTWNGRKVWSFIRSLLGQSDYTGLSCQFLERLVACETWTTWSLLKTSTV